MLVRTYTKPNQMVLDPYMGSGTTGVACVRTGRNFIGVELDADYYATANTRLTQQHQQDDI
jgi:site-specific DNA-methyltransferase (adenine-specific)